MKNTIIRQRQLKFDEINALGRELTEYEDGIIWSDLPDDKKKEVREKFHDCLIDFYIDGFASGILQLEQDMPGKGYEFLDVTNEMPNPYDYLDIKYSDGETVTDKFEKYAESGDAQKMQVLVEAEANRMWNVGTFNAGKGKATTKTWQTMKDNRVRNTHWYIDDVTIPFDELFVTFDGDSAYAPGGFSKSENNVNCRCWLEISV